MEKEYYRLRDLSEEDIEEEFESYEKYSIALGNAWDDAKYERCCFSPSLDSLGMCRSDFY
jgi:hypothetical protein